MHPDMDFRIPEESLDLWHLPNTGEGLGGTLQPKVVGLDLHLRRLVELRTGEGRGCCHQVLHC